MGLRDVTPVIGARATVVGQFARARENADIAPGPDDAVVIGSVRSITGDLAVATFIRVDPVTGLSAPVQRGRGQRLPGFSFLTRSSEAAPKALVTQAGTYALVDLDMVQVCLGTIAFTVEPGGVVNLGAIVLNEEPSTAADSLGPVPTRQVRIDAADPETARVALSRAPQLASRAEPASYFNGLHYPCSNAFPWRVAGIVMPGAPYRTANEAAAAEE